MSLRAVIGLFIGVMVNAIAIMLAFVPSLRWGAILAWPGSFAVELLPAHVQGRCGPTPEAIFVCISTNAVVYSALFAFVPLFWKRKAVNHPACSRCGYCLLGNVSGVCPECGFFFIKSRPLEWPKKSDYEQRIDK